ncbi:DUF4179 domain-containing protein [Solibacillus sp. MA9]|uniref:DUF4179 domain-containing protein n=1 Tax=Solibacillus palustris TaxID=2908203 RepID=A0ABS9UFY9_9BACL|nr:DUF4179 domain-containing protein [Solibacillus sp. MA9]MCH7323241.1 DUF4179 domain-containing protein [Solibacillus sp. MA9]
MSFLNDLNDVKLDIEEYEQIPLSAVEQKRIIQRTQKRLKSKKALFFKRKKHFVSAIASISAISFITLNIAFPTFAEKLPTFTNIFEFFTDNERNIFEDYSEHTTYIGQTQESNGISITVTDAVYDKENITIAYTIKSEKDLGERPVLLEDIIVDEFVDQYKHSGYSKNYLVKKIDEHEYAVLYVYELITGSKPETINISWQGDNVTNLNNGNQLVSGHWNFEFSLQALENSVTSFKSPKIKSSDTGVEITLVKMTQSPISTTIKLAEKVDERIVSQEQEELRTVSIEYLVSDDLGNEYNIIHYRDTGHSTDFNINHISTPRITMNIPNNNASYITITPIVTAYKVVNSDGLLEQVIEPYKIEPIHVPLNK